MGGPLASRIALIGLSGAGKSAVAPLLASRLGFTAVDVDERIARAARRPVASVIRERGEAAFRDLEADALARALAPARAAEERGRVIACGGGILERPENRERLRGSAFVVWLLVEPEEAAARLGPGSAERPLLNGGDVAAGLRALLARRRGEYEEAASARVLTGGKSAAGVAEEIAALWERSRAAWGSSAS